jgi:hypothetical protein
VEDADPLESEGSERSLAAQAASATALVEGVRPEGSWDGLRDPLDEGLAEKLRARIKPVDPRSAAAFGKHSRRSPKATRRRGARAGPAPGKARKGAEAEVVDDQEVGRGEAQQAPVVGAVGTRGAELLERLLRRHVEHSLSEAAGTMPERLRDVRLASARRPEWLLGVALRARSRYAAGFWVRVPR